MYQDSYPRKSRSQEGTPNVCKFRKNHKSNFDFSCQLKPPLTNIATVKNLTRFATLDKKKPKGASECQEISQKPQKQQGILYLAKKTHYKYRQNRKNNKISQKSQKKQGIFLLAKNTLYKYRKNNRYNKNHDFGKEEAPKRLKNRKNNKDFSCQLKHITK